MMGKAEDFVNRRQREAESAALQTFTTERDRIFDRISRLLEGIEQVFERTEYEGATAIFHRNEKRVGYRLTQYDPDTASGAEAYVLASDGKLFVNNWDFSDPNQRPNCAQQNTRDISGVEIALRTLRERLESPAPS